MPVPDAVRKIDPMAASARNRWMFLAAAEWLLVWIWHAVVLSRHLVPYLAARATYGAGFFLFAAFVLGAFGRGRNPAWMPVWRFLTLFIGALAALVEVNLHAWPKGLAPLFWASAMVGVSLACILARMLPAPLRAVWLGHAAPPPNEV